MAVVCCCGSGNNGGDGLVIGRVLAAAGIAVRILVLGHVTRLSGDCLANYKILSVLAENEPESIDLRVVEQIDGTDLANCSVIVDALLGTGVSGQLRPAYESAVEAINKCSAATIAIDIPTGLDANKGTTPNVAIRATSTVAMAAAKPGLLLNDGPAHAGKTTVAEIGIPTYVLSRHAEKDGCGLLPSKTDIASRLPIREANAHKYSSGLVLTVAGSPGLTGAPVLASEAALRAGAGAVICAAPNSIISSLDEKLIEVMTSGLDDGEYGLDANAALSAIMDIAESKKVRSFVLGCGLGRGKETVKFVNSLLIDERIADIPRVVDADGLYALSTDPDWTKAGNARRENWVLTPHQGEFERLCGESFDWTERAGDR